MPHWVPCRVPSYSDLLGRWPALQSAIRQDPPSPAHGGLDGTADIIAGDTRGAENSPWFTRALAEFRHHLIDLWRRTLRRRIQKDRMTWARMTKLADDRLPKPTILHTRPSERLAVTHPRWEPYAGSR